MVVAHLEVLGDDLVLTVVDGDEEDDVEEGDGRGRWKTRGSATGLRRCSC